MNLPRILVVDDQFARNATERYVFLQNSGLVKRLGGMGEGQPYADVVFCSGQRDEGTRLINDYRVVRDAVAGGRWSLVLLDVQFDSGDRDECGEPLGQAGDDFFGVSIRENLKTEFPGLPVVMLTGKPQHEIAEASTPYLSKHKLGAYELRRTLLRFGNIESASARVLLGLGEDILADDPTSLAAFRSAFVHAGSNASILILGESGVGKEVLASFVHRMSGRSTGPLVAVNVAAIPKDLVESELFGIGKRVATGVDGRPGKFELASGGTLFLDEIGDMPMETQTKILRALQERRIERVGEDKEVPIDVRLICATSLNLEQMAEMGSFRVDLLHRINTVPITMPPLRERRLDIAPLARHYLQSFASRQGKNGLTFSAEALAALETLPFAGNVRELKNIAERIASAAGHHQIIWPSDVQEALGSKGAIRPAKVEAHKDELDSSSPRMAIAPDGLTLDEALAMLERVVIPQDDAVLGGAKPRVEDAVLRLLQRLAGAALAKYRKPMSATDVDISDPMRLLTGNTELRTNGPGRELNAIMGLPTSFATSIDERKSFVAALIGAWETGSYSSITNVLAPIKQRIESGRVKQAEQRKSRRGATL